MATKKKPIKRKTSDVKQALRTKARPVRLPPVNPADFLDSGSTLLNLAVSGDPRGAYSKGRVFHLVGDSAAGKTFFVLTALAEAARNPSYAKHRLVYDDVESGALMDIPRYFGTLEERLEPPALIDGEWTNSGTVEEFYYHLDDALKKGPCIYVLDSLDALSSKYEHAKFDEHKLAARRGTKAAGDYGDGKARSNSVGIRRMMQRLEATGSILIYVSQTRDKIGASPFEDGRTYSGGRALTFYSTAQIWFSIAGKVTRDVRGRRRQVGIYCRADVRKSRYTGRLSSVKVPILNELGIDDVGGCVNYLVDEKTWSKDSSGRITAKLGGKTCKGFDQDVCRWIEKEGLQAELRELVTGTWREIAEACRLGREPRY